MFEKRYKNEMNKISPAKDLINQTKAAMRVEMKSERKHPIMREENQVRTFRAKRSILIAVIIVILAVSITVFAALGGFEWFISRFNPDFADVIEPVMAYSEDQGIQMTVVGAQRFDNIAIVYLSVQDINGENRLTEQMNFRDGFHVRINPSISGGYSLQKNMLYFDNGTITAYFEIRIAARDNSPLSDPLTLGSFLIAFNNEAGEIASGDWWNYAIRYEYAPMKVNLANVRRGQAMTLGMQYTEHSVMGLGDLPPARILTPSHYAIMPHGDIDQWVSMSA